MLKQVQKIFIKQDQFDDKGVLKSPIIPFKRKKLKADKAAIMGRSFDYVAGCQAKTYSYR